MSTTLASISPSGPERPEASPAGAARAPVQGDSFSALFDAKVGASAPERPSPIAGPTTLSTSWGGADSTPGGVAGPEGQWGAPRAPAEETPRPDRTDPARKEGARRASDEDDADAAAPASDGREGAATASSASSSEAEASEGAAEPAATLRLAKTGVEGARAQPEAEAEAEAVEAEASAGEVTEVAEAPDLAAPLAIEVAPKGPRRAGVDAKADGVAAIAGDAARGPRGLDPGGRVVKAAASAGPSGFDADLVERLQAGQQLAQLKDGRLRLSIDEGGERVTVTLLERDGTLSLAARTASRATAEALERNVAELEAALGAHGLSLASFDAQSEAPDQGEPGPPRGATEDPAEQDEVARPLPILKRRIIA